MNRCVKFAVGVLACCLHPVVSNSAVIHVDEPDPVGLTLGTGVGVDLNQNGTVDLTVSYYGIPICIGPPEGGTFSCSHGIALEPAPWLKLLGNADSFAPIAMLPGQIVGPAIPAERWLGPSLSPLWLMYRYSNVPGSYQGYPEFTAGLNRFAIGFQLIEGGIPTYGFADIALWRTSPADPNSNWALPRVEGIFVADEPGVPVTVSLIPEPDRNLLLGTGAMVLWHKLRKRRR